MKEMLDVYEQPYAPNHPVIRQDESPHPFISEIRQGFVDIRGVKHVDDEYRREGVVDIYIICELKAGKRYVQVRDSHDSHQWAKVIAHIAETLHPNAGCITRVGSLFGVEPGLMKSTTGEGLKQDGSTPKSVCDLLFCDLFLS